MKAARSAESEEGVFHGLKCDQSGNVYVGGPRGIWVIDAEGEHLGIIKIPEVTSNFNGGVPDWGSRFITASPPLYRINLRVSGRREPYMG